MIKKQAALASWDSNQCTPEIRLIRLCCRYALGQMNTSDCRPYFTHLFDNLDEQRFLELLHEERVLLLVYQVLTGDLKPHVPSNLMACLSQKSKITLTRQLALMVTQRDIEKAFQAEKISHVFLKGPSLNQMLWGRRMMRYSGDLDLLILPKDIFRAHIILKQLKFKTALSEKKLRFHQHLNKISTKKDAVYWHEDLSQCIELHWKSGSTEFIFKPKDAWVHGIDDELHALYLCLHAARHSWSRLIWLVDIIALIELKQLDIMQLRVLAKKRKITPVIDEMILLAKQWLGIHLLPEKSLSKLKKRATFLDKRVVAAKKKNPEALLQRLLTHSFCSNYFYQMRLWAQIFLGVIIMRVINAVKAAHVS
ncbi:MAG: nucleotidyltransferase family protein [Legionella sp.]|nr:nucleotidyltransferase family protein [Legionella sp.]